ncbi:alpha/beta fold hydrolase [Paraburkholderia sp. ZP32-5]|uniref:alpha/beta fold hydrolase n=1 Tax=Paraburkholderia sp. ZP32-5 TaxID=2883245 RepID=UPI001F1C0C37|nr:alpha/beta hydrolase [Paraburkholderia sp. ZP32-5]
MSSHTVSTTNYEKPNPPTDNWKTQTQERKVLTEFGQVSIRTGGNENGRDMIFWPSLMLDASMWSYQFDHFAPDYRVVLINPPGIGESDALRRPISVEESVACLKAILDTLSIEKCIVVGNSWGSLVAGVAAADLPERILAAIITNGTASPSTPELIEQMTGVAAGLEQCETAPDWLLPAVQQGFGSHAAEARNPEFLAYLGQVLREDPVSLAFAIKGILLAREDLHETMRRIRDVPVLVIAGAEDRVFDTVQTQRMVDAIAGSELILLPDTGHLAARENPAAVNTAIDAFLIKHRADQ